MTTINKVGDIFDSEADILVHGVNMLGGEVAGLADIVFTRYPRVRDEYDALIEDEDMEMKLGAVLFVGVGEFIIANAFTQELPGPNADADAIRDSLRSVKEFAQENALSVAIPRIGCGIGGLQWEDVEKIIDDVFDDDSVLAEKWDFR